MYINDVVYLNYLNEVGASFTSLSLQRLFQKLIVYTFQTMDNILGVFSTKYTPLSKCRPQQQKITFFRLILVWT